MIVRENIETLTGKMAATEEHRIYLMFSDEQTKNDTEKRIQNNKIGGYHETI